MFSAILMPPVGYIIINVHSNGFIYMYIYFERNLFCTVRAILRCSPRGLVNASVSDGLTALHQVSFVVFHSLSFEKNHGPI